MHFHVVPLYKDFQVPKKEIINCRFVCRTQPYVGNIRWESVRVPAPGAKYTCGGTFMFSVVYSEPNIEVSRIILIVFVPSKF
jgi:hypothetical protein